jgi:transcription elongation factor Elf1
MLKFLFCNHTKITWPLSIKNSHPYVVCLNCGKEFLYEIGKGIISIKK